MTAMTKHIDFTQDYLNECLIYGKNTGRFTWLKRPLEHFISLSACNTWNGKYAGENACRTDANGYEVIAIDGKVLKAHHAAFMIMEGVKPKEVDHQDGVRDNNAWDNIRSVTRLENCKNRKVRADSSSGICGVHYRKDNGKWRAKIAYKGKRVNLGQFATKEEAIKARQEAEKKYGYHENHGRVD